MNIFISYGHDRFSPLAERLKEDLRLHDHTVYFDKEFLVGSSEWENRIEQNILDSDWLILFMTNHSVRRPDGVCLDEVSLARHQGKKILPIMVQNVLPPFCIARLEWLNMMDYFSEENESINEEKYNQKLEEILNLIDGIRLLKAEGQHASLINALRPLDNDVFFDSFRHNYWGREWLTGKYDQWVSNPDASKLFIIFGKAGSGKTAFSAHLSSKKTQIAGIHFCKFNDSDRANPKKALMSLAFHLSTQVPEYSEQLASLHDLDSLEEKSVHRLFEYLFVEPLHKMPNREEPVVLIIDALDEAQNDLKNDILDVIASDFGKTPKWLRLLITSRPESLILKKLGKYSPVTIDDNADNDNDIYGYLRHVLKDVVVEDKTNIIQRIADRCQGNFLYAKELAKSLINGLFSLDDVNSLPSELDDIYMSYFDRIFLDKPDVYKSTVRPILEVLVSSYEPVKKDLLCEMSKVEEYDFEDAIELISPLFPLKNDVVTPIHKSVFDWQTDKNESGRYWVSLKKGHARILNYYQAQYEKKHLSDSFVKYIVKHALKSEDYETAFTYLCDENIQTRRLSLIHADSFFKELFDEIDSLKESNSKYVSKMLRTEFFLSLVSEYREFLYNSGLFFKLRSFGFDSVLEGLDMSKLTPQLGLAMGDYYYITERFSKSINVLSLMINQHKEAYSVEELAGIYNTLALCYRKFADFDKSQHYFETALSVSKNLAFFEYGRAMVVLAKITYHKKEWEKCYQQINEALENITEAYNRAENDDKKKTYILFKAESYRIFADAIVWNDGCSDASEQLGKALEIYNSLVTRDRYFIRFKYTTALVKTLNGGQVAPEEFDELLAQAEGIYDKAQILYIKGISLYLRGDINSCIDSLEEALIYATQIDAQMEIGEIITVLRLCGETSHTIPDNADILSWCEHISSVLHKKVL